MGFCGVRRNEGGLVSKSSKSISLKENVGGFDDHVCAFRVGRPASGVVREARAVGATGKSARDNGARGDVFGHLGEKLAAVAGERVRGDDGEPDTKRRRKQHRFGRWSRRGQSVVKIIHRRWFDDDGRAGRGEADATRDADDIVGRVGTLVSNGD